MPENSTDRTFGKSGSDLPKELKQILSDLDNHQIYVDGVPHAIVATKIERLDREWIRITPTPATAQGSVSWTVRIDRISAIRHLAPPSTDSFEWDVY